MGEDAWRIHTVGSTYVDRVVAGLYATPTAAREAVGLSADEPFLLVLVHPETYRSRDENRRLAETVLAAVRATGMRSVATYPASDPGYETVLDVLADAADDEAFVVRPNLENDVYLGLMAGAEAIVGNSSAGLVEAPYLRLPAVNVGDRQRNRQRDANVVDADVVVESVSAAIKHTRSPAFRAALATLEPRLGDGGASERIVRVLKAAERDARLLQKQIAY